MQVSRVEENESLITYITSIFRIWRADLEAVGNAYNIVNLKKQQNNRKKHMNPDKNTSNSFKVFLEGIRKIMKEHIVSVEIVR